MIFKAVKLKNPKKPKKAQKKTKKTQKNPKKPTGLGFFKKIRVFSNPGLLGYRCETILLDEKTNKQTQLV